MMLFAPDRESRDTCLPVGSAELWESTSRYGIALPNMVQVTS
jgi:hypothetical protein